MLEERDRDGVALTWDLIRRAVLTHDALPEVRARGYKCSHPEILQDFHDAYGYHDAKPPRFRPTPRDVDNMLPVLAWLTDHRRRDANGARDLKLILGRARGFSWMKLATKMGRSDRTVQRWFDGAVSIIYVRHHKSVWDMI